nr:U4/U6 small nuclear ribonucleoprotein Prp31 [Pelodiscus sinensis]|eukprot:XP_025039312.1 U4/U6 small nuclear ribonucleoprotein Prp31 [Pelodiscus sinensis]
MVKIEEYISKQSKATEVMGPDANNLTVEIENELNIIHKFIRDKYSKRFPELESLVPNALDYIRTVKVCAAPARQRDKGLAAGEGEDGPCTCTTPEARGGGALAGPTGDTELPALHRGPCHGPGWVPGSAEPPGGQTRGGYLSSMPRRQQLTEEELERIEEACDMALELNQSKHRIYEYVESRMSFIAPNLSIIVGASTAAKVMGIAGGLTNLSKMPACNIMLLGAQRRTLSGFSSTSVLPHTGYIYHSDIVQSLPPDLRRKAARLVAAKCTLAARVDSFHESQEGKVGYELKEEIERKFDKWQEPPPVKQVKPLPAPLDGQRKKRGGRRYRKMKERLGLTEIRKQANRMSFGEIEEDAYQEDLGFSLGHLGKSGSGRVRQTQVNEATKARISKTLQRTLQKQSMVYGGKSTIRDRSSGTASSVAFTPLQGLEIVNPQAAEKKVAEANQKYFSSMAEFVKVKSEKSGILSST